MPEIMGESPVLDTLRLRLTALSADALQAWIDGDGVALFELTGVRFPEPVMAPPLVGEDLPMLRDRTAQEPEEVGWWIWLISRQDDETAVGVCGLAGRPDDDGVVFLGYSVYPEHEGHGFATEASTALVEWTLRQAGVGRVRALVPRWNQASVAVARKIGLVEVGEEHDPDVGAVTIYERLRED